jgi:dihydrofolate reductase
MDDISGVNIILAVDSTWGIGKLDMEKGPGMPWVQPGTAGLKTDMKRFADLTMGNTVIMGRTTWESIPARFRPLKGRDNLVISTTATTSVTSLTSEVITCPSIDVAIDYHAGTDQRPPLAGSVFIIGGARLYDEAIKRDLVNRVYLTRILEPLEFGCNVHVKELEKALTTLFQRIEVQPDITENGVRYRFEVWDRVTG